jgi:quercetin dioxygenase-like cupin family protein
VRCSDGGASVTLGANWEATTVMKRRMFAGCALCAGLSLLTEGAVAQAPGFTRTVLRRIDQPGDKMATIQVLVEIDANTLVARHTHPGVETAYVIEGGGEFSMKGEANRLVKAGDTFQVPTEVPHALHNGPARTRVISVYVVDKDKPLASPAPE